MRMWMLPPQMMCRRHLCGEHAEVHMLAGTLLRGKSIRGFLEKNLLEPARIYPRHEELADEMMRRGYRHASPLPFISPEVLQQYEDYRVDTGKSRADLYERCSECAGMRDQLRGERE